LLKIITFNGETAPTGGIFYTHPILLEISANGHRSMISCEVVNAGKYDLIIPFEWWNHKHPLKNVANPVEWVFQEEKCDPNMEVGAVADLYEWDEAVTYDDEAQYVGWIAWGEEGGIPLETLLKPYWQYKELFEEKKAKMLAPGGMFDHAINLKEGAEPPWGPIYLMLAYQVTELDKYLKRRLREGTIADCKSPYGLPILFVPNLDGTLWLCVHYRNLNKLTLLNTYPQPLC